jgi:hypothetical protein
MKSDNFKKRIRNISLAEKVLWIVIVIFAIGFFIGFKIFARKGEYVQVRVSGKIVAEYPLDEELETVIKGYDNGENKLVIKSGEAYIMEANCPDKLCMNQGKINLEGQSLVCLPNKVVVEITNNDKNTDSTVESVDAIAK